LRLELRGRLWSASASSAAANPAIQLLKRIINWGTDTERCEGGNLATKIDMFPEYSRKRVAQRTELAKIFAALEPDREPSRDLRDFVWLALNHVSRIL
jgi:hypothetical protein